MKSALGPDHAYACRVLEDRLGRPLVPDPFRCEVLPIDREHALVVAQHRACVAALQRGDARGIGAEMASYAAMMVAHYLSEEDLMREIGYPERIDHARLHRRYAAALHAMMEELRRAGPAPALAQWMREGSPHWLGVHLHNDLAISRWIGDRRIRLASPDVVWRAGVPCWPDPPPPVELAHPHQE